MKSKQYIGGNIFNKYESKNPLVRLVVRLYLKRLFSILGELQFRNVLDVGGGEGYIAGKIAKQFTVPVVCVEPNKQFIQQHIAKHKGVSYVRGSAYHIPKKAQSFDLVLCLEVLEHLTQPEVALRELQRTAKRSIIITVPNELLFRIANILRFTYLSQLGNTPGHINAWTSKSFQRFICQQAPQATFQSAFLWNFAIITKK